MSDPTGKGYLDKAGMFVACKMVALVQSDTPLTIDNARFQCPAPNFGDETAPGAPVAKVAPKQGGNVNFLVKPEEKRKYDALFDQLQPEDEKLPGDKVHKFVISYKSLQNLSYKERAFAFFEGEVEEEAFWKIIPLFFTLRILHLLQSV